MISVSCLDCVVEILFWTQREQIGRLGRWNDICSILISYALTKQHKLNPNYWTSLCNNVWSRINSVFADVLCDVGKCNWCRPLCGRFNSLFGNPIQQPPPLQSTNNALSFLVSEKTQAGLTISRTIIQSNHNLLSLGWLLLFCVLAIFDIPCSY